MAVRRMLACVSGLGSLSGLVLSILTLLHLIEGGLTIYLVVTGLFGLLAALLALWPTADSRRGWESPCADGGHPEFTPSRPKVSGSADETPRVDENVQFTVYRPKAVQPRKWYPLLAFAHLSERRPDAPPSAPDPLEEVKRQAQRLLADVEAEYQPRGGDAQLAIPAAGELTFIPSMEGVEFKPAACTFTWSADIHSEKFILRAHSRLNGRTAHGRVSVYLGLIRVATIDLAIRVDRRCRAPEHRQDTTSGAVSAQPWRKVFVSYSHHDTAIVEEVEKWGRFWGNDFIRDVEKLRRGEEWSKALARMIEEADEFMLFWSSHSMHSEFVKQEWEHALRQKRARFVCPCYWEEP